VELEKFVSKMMAMNTYGRLWHWSTGNAQHHTTFEQFLTQNEQFTDSLVESALGNDVDLKTSNIDVTAAMGQPYELKDARESLSAYRSQVADIQKKFTKKDATYSAELTAILDDVVELCSKTLYLLRLK